MKWHQFFLSFGLLAPCAWGQEPADLAQERARIDAERARIISSHAREEEACYQRFAVSGCLSEVRARRRKELETLQRQANRLDDADRRRRGAEQLQRIDDKVQARREQQQVQEVDENRARQAYEEKQAESRRKQAQANQRGEANPAETPSAEGKDVQTAPGADTSQRAAARQAYEDKLKRLQERRQRRDKLLEEKKGKPDRHLPVPD